MFTVRDLMLTDPVVVTAKMPLEEAMTLMQVTGHRQLPVLDENGRLTGIITDRDVRLVANIPILEDMQVEDCMTSDPVTVSPDTPAFRAANMLSTYKFGALPVLEGGKLVGMITITNFLQFFARQKCDENASSG